VISWLAVAFFCVNNECAFYRSAQLFDTREKCLHHLSATLEVLEEKADAALGNCFDIRMNREASV
jgi:hypothetical protein